MQPVRRAGLRGLADARPHETLLVSSFARDVGFFREQVVAPYDHFVLVRLREIVGVPKTPNGSPPRELFTALFHQQYRTETTNVARVVVSAVSLQMHTMPRDETLEPMTPQIARARGKSYSIPIHIVFRLKYETAEPDDEGQQQWTTKSQRDEELCVGRIPVMVRSVRCSLDSRNSGLTAPYTPAEIASFGEDPDDPGGYFIVEGSEKILLTQEQMALNRLVRIAEKDGTWSVQVRSRGDDTTGSSIVSLTSRAETACIVCAAREFTKPVPVLVLFRAMGGDALALVERFPRALTASLERLRESTVTTVDSAVEWLSTRMSSTHDVSASEKIVRTRFALDEKLIPHVLGRANKLAYLDYMLSELVACLGGERLADDRDNIENKRYETSCALLCDLFQDLFAAFCKTTRMSMQLHKKGAADAFKTFNGFVSPVGITSGMQYCLSTGNWTARKLEISRQGVAQPFLRISRAVGYSMLRRVCMPTGQRNKSAAIRMLHNSHFGYWCLSEVPEGAGSGVSKALALLATYSKHRPNVSAILQRLAPHCAGTDKLFLDGTLFEQRVDGPRLAGGLRVLRRSGSLPHDVGVAYHANLAHLDVRAKGDRVVRPLLLLQSADTLDYTALESGALRWSDLVKRGVVEFLDAEEVFSHDVVVAPTRRDATEGGVGAFTHLEIHPGVVFGLIASLVPFPNHNQSPRLTYFTAMAKQAIGPRIVVPRYDANMYELNYVQQPIVTTLATRLLPTSDAPSGMNLVVAVLCDGGYNQEDSLIVNRAAIDRGMMSASSLHTFKYVVRPNEVVGYYEGWQTQKRRRRGADVVSLHSQNNVVSTASARIFDPNRLSVWARERTRELGPSWQMKQTTSRPAPWDKLDDAGVVRVGERIRRGDVVISKALRRTNLSESPVDKSEFYDDDTGIVHAVTRVESTTATIYTIVVRTTRIPVVGDKFTTRASQKGTVGQMVSQEDLPFSCTTGMSPDVVINPHAFPSRMTIAYFIELILSKIGCLAGHPTFDGSAFSEHAEYDTLAGHLATFGFLGSGKERFISGRTGELLEGDVLMGPMFHLRLKHMVDDKIHARGTGSVMQLTRQPNEGRSNHGALRFGEMERDCVVSYGAARVMTDRTVDNSDPYLVDVCDACGRVAAGKRCRVCNLGDSASYTTVKTRYCFKLLTQELLCMGVVMRWTRTT